MIVDVNKIKKSVGIIGESNTIEEMCTLIGQVSNIDISVLITGESGSGKEMVAKALHRNSKRKFEALITVNCAAIPSGIIESELFGHKKGAFTGAYENRKGYFEAANKGTIFLDEIGELPLETQAKLLRVIEQGEFIKVGETKTDKVDVRIIVATNKKLNQEVQNKKFRQDLYFRLKTISIDAAPLREHLSDLFLYIERFGLEFTAKNDIPFKGFSKEAIDLMKKYNWPGNIRELKNTIESLLTINRGKRIQEDMVRKYLKLDEYYSSNILPILVDKESDAVERELILKQLLFLRQDVNELKQLMLSKSNKSTEPANKSLFILPESNRINNNNDLKNTDDGLLKGIRDDVIGEITMDELEKEIIDRTLKSCNGKPRKREYRKYKIKEVKGIDDFAMIREVVTRRYKRVIKEKTSLPDLILIDGGKGQLSSAKSALDSLGLSFIPVIGLAKKMEEVFKPQFFEPQSISKTSPGLVLLKQIRDESHRFAITFHKQLRDKGMFN